MENSIIGVFYKPPHTDVETFYEQLNQLITPLDIDKRGNMPTLWTTI